MHSKINNLLRSKILRATIENVLKLLLNHGCGYLIQIINRQPTLYESSILIEEYKQVQQKIKASMINSKGYFYSEHHEPKSQFIKTRKKKTTSSILDQECSKTTMGVEGVSYTKLKSAFDMGTSFWSKNPKSRIRNTRVSPVITFQRLQLILNNTCSAYERNSRQKKSKNSINQNTSYSGFSRKNTAPLNNSKTLGIPFKAEKNSELKQCLFKKDTGLPERPSTGLKHRPRYDESEELGADVLNITNSKYFVPSSKLRNSRNRSSRESRNQTSYHSQHK